MDDIMKLALALVASKASLYRYRRFREAGRCYRHTAAVGHMPFEGHRTCAETREAEEANHNRRRSKRSDFGYAG